MFESGKVVDVKEKVESICINYLKIMSRCISDSKFKEEFISNPRPYLEEEVGMRIPEKAKIILDPNGRHWPEVRINTGNGTIDFIEHALSVKEDKWQNTGVVESNTITCDKTEQVIKDINANLDDCEVLVILPFFTSDTDLLTEYKFKDDNEPSIVLSSC